MSTQLRRTLAEMAAYIDKHETYFGFKPHTDYIKFNDWLEVKKEAEQWMKYTDPNPPRTTSLSVNEVPIYFR